MKKICCPPLICLAEQVKQRSTGALLYVFFETHVSTEHTRPHKIYACKKRKGPALATEVFPVKQWRLVDHHEAHARMSFFDSPFQQALILSYDGGGNDGLMGRVWICQIC